MKTPFYGNATALVTVIAMLAGSAMAASPPPPARSASAATSAAPSSGRCIVNEPPFEGRIGESVAGSTPVWPRPVRPAQDAPNVLIWLLDDVGFGMASAFGGGIATPNLERVAASGLKYTNFHSTPLCSPSRAALLTGRNAHNVHMGSHANTAMGYPGYDAYVPKSAATTAKVLNDAGYATFALGKWDHLPARMLKPSGPFDLWPLGQGFERFYGFLAYESDHFRPTLWQDNSLIGTPATNGDYFLTTDLADRAIGYINELESVDPDRPFYMYWATGAVHSPHQATGTWLDRYRGRFDAGWDSYREETLKRQKAMGLVPESTTLAPLPDSLPAWNSLTSAQKKLYARQMEAIAAQLSQTDHEFGRILDSLERTGQLDNTMIIVTADNGASAEGGPAGAFNVLASTSGVAVGDKENLAHLDRWGGPDVLGHYSAAWAIAANTPFRYFKQAAHEGGHRVPMVIAWPKQIPAAGLRAQYAHLIDIGPTILDAARIAPPDCVDGHRQKPLDGLSLRYSFADPAAPAARTTQYYELWGNRGIYHDGWKAVVLHKPRAWDILGTVPFDEDTWELYDLRSDPGETRDLAATHPAKLKEMQAIFAQEARRNNVFPIDDNLGRGYEIYRQLHGDQREFVYYMPGTRGMPDRAMAPIGGKNYEIEIFVEAGEKPEGVLLAVGGVELGFSFYLKEGRLHYDYNDFDINHFSIVDRARFPAGESRVRLNFSISEPGRGTARLYIGDRLVGETAMIHRSRGAYSGGGELLNIGLDMGSSPTRNYEPPFELKGAAVEKVRIRLLDEQGK